MKTFEQICEENYLRIYRYIYIMTKDKQVSEDLTQEVFLKAYEKGNALLEHPSPEGFLCKTAKFLTYDAIRKSAKERTEPLEQAERQGIAESSSEDLLQAMEEEQGAALDEEQAAGQIINMLSKEEQSLYRDYYLEHHSMKEIAKGLGIKESTVRMRYLRLRKKIRKLVRELRQEELMI